jgi:hypothetical protein
MINDLGFDFEVPRRIIAEFLIFFIIGSTYPKPLKENPQAILEAGFVWWVD